MSVQSVCGGNTSATDYASSDVKNQEKAEVIDQVEIAKQAFQAKNYKQAKMVLKQAIVQKPDNLEARTLLVMMSFAAKNYACTRLHVKYLAEQKDFSVVLTKMGEAARDLGDTKKAGEFCAEAKKWVPKKPKQKQQSGTQHVKVVVQKEPLFDLDKMTQRMKAAQHHFEKNMQDRIAQLSRASKQPPQAPEQSPQSWWGRVTGWLGFGGNTQ